MDIVINYDLIEDYCDGTTLYVAPDYSGVVEISAEADLTAITATGYYKPGAMAHLAGWGSAWQLDVDFSTWAPLGAASE